MKNGGVFIMIFHISKRTQKIKIFKTKLKKMHTNTQHNTTFFFRQKHFGVVHVGNRIDITAALWF